MSRYGNAALDDELQRLAFRSSAGFRHAELYRSSIRMGQLIAGGVLDEERARAALGSIGRSMGLVTGDAYRQVERGLIYGCEQPRGPARDGQMLRNKTDAVLRAVELWEEATLHSWSGRVGATRLRLLAAFLLVVMQTGKVKLGLSARQWAEAAGMSKSVVSARSPSLTPWVVKCTPGNRGTGEAAVWQVGLPPKRENVDSRAKPDGVASGLSIEPRLPAAGSIQAPSGDHFHRKNAAWMIANLFELDGPDMTVGLVLAATGFHPSTIRSNLRYLASLRLVERVDRFTWRAIRSGDSEALASVPGYGDKRRQRHAEDRAAYRRRFVDHETGEIREPRSPGARIQRIRRSSPGSNRV